VTDEAPPKTLPGEGPTEKIDQAGEAPDPVFVDDSGKRRKRIRMAFFGLGGLGLLYAGLVGVSLAGGPLNPESLIPFPQKFARPAETQAVAPVGNAAQAGQAKPHATGTKADEHSTPAPARPPGPGNPIPAGPTAGPTPAPSKSLEATPEPTKEPASPTPPPASPKPSDPPPSNAPPSTPPPAGEAGPVPTDNGTVGTPPQTKAPDKTPDPVQTSSAAVTPAAQPSETKAPTGPAPEPATSS
jgi:hypothetical protein